MSNATKSDKGFAKALKAWTDEMNDWYFGPELAQVADELGPEYREPATQTEVKKAFLATFPATRKDHEGDSYRETFLMDRGRWSGHLDTADREELGDAIAKARLKNPKHKTFKTPKVELSLRGFKTALRGYLVESAIDDFGDELPELPDWEDVQTVYKVKGTKHGFTVRVGDSKFKISIVKVS